MILRTLRTALEEERRGHKPKQESKDEQAEALQYEGEEEQEGAVYGVYLRSSSAQQAPVKVLTLRAGTLPRLVRHLLEARFLGDTSYIPVFLATYRAFSSTSEVVTLLLERLQSNNHSQTSDQSHGGKDDDISSLFCAWMSQHPKDFLSLQPEKRDQLSFCLSRLRKSNLVAKLQELRAGDKNGADQPPAAGVKAEHSNALDVLIFQAGYVAEQLTCLEAALFLKVVPYECLGSVWSRRDKGGDHFDRCHSVRETVRHFNRLSGAVTASCVQDPQLKPQQRARIIEKWLKVAEECWSLRNFSSVYAILSALQSTAVHRLKRVWAETTKEIQRSYQEMSEVFSEQDNYARMRELLFQSQDSSDATSKRHPPRSKDPRATGVIPYLGVFLTDLVMLDSAIRDQLENGYLNFEKRRKEFESLSQIRMLQNVCLGYRFTSDPLFVKWFQKLRSMSEDESYRLSCDIEPTQDMTPGPPMKPTVVITHCTDLLASIVAPFGPSMHLVAWDAPCERLTTPSLTAQQRSPSVPTLDSQCSPKPPPKGFLTPAVAGRTHRRSASCGSPFTTVQHSSSAEHIAEPGKIPDPAEDHRIIRARLEPAEQSSVYKSVRINSQEKAPAVIDRILRKHHMNTQGSHELVQILPGNKELVFPGTANVFYAMSSASLDFLVRPHQAVTMPPAETKPQHRVQMNATYPKIKVKAGDLARSLF
ncbi:PREDICTED: ral guanine nucleotide dissociation stimulator-like 2 isoform X1 [Nanorana parkeri]|uniref:ral guanine nucleotide dissociation stimulator-like 2 isoform X1 n=1 Tax=Nanorana parkeri TaxID=125878 RepID=UPI0008547151|nr:PREDICTED: ral guanine nucleotide dissociation stimulator-like 2 isoform X1 [Nanorana parkeri]